MYICGINCNDERKIAIINVSLETFTSDLIDLSAITIFSWRKYKIKTTIDFYDRKFCFAFEFEKKKIRKDV